MDVFKELITSVGFPIAVTYFLLVRVEKKLDQLNQTLISLIEMYSKQVVQQGDEKIYE